MHPPEIKEEALRLIAEGLNDCEVSRTLGMPRATIRDWHKPRYVSRVAVETCPRCWRAAKPIRFSIEDYSELLAIYLGDGCVSRMGRTWRLRVSLDTKYPQIIDEGRALLARCFPLNRVDVVPFHDGACVNLSVYNGHLPCVLPQHAPGKKHERRIALEEWQLALVIGAPWEFIRGCIRTDGCVFINRTGPYEYLSYAFGNMSRDISNLLAFALWHVGVEYRLTRGCKRGMSNLRINRRASVARMLEHVGIKA